MEFFCIVIALATFCHHTEGYNLEERLPLYKLQNEGNRFGFSVALHKTSLQEQTTGSIDNSLLVVGSPTAPALSSQTNTERPGAVFYCPVSTDPRDCTRVKMDEGGSTAGNNKTGQWLGVSLKSQGDGKYLITCAHRHAVRKGFGEDETESLCGKCFLLNSRGSNELYEITPEESNGEFISSPCFERPDNGYTLNSKYAFGYAQAGVSVSWFGDEYLLGGPGAYAWSGGMFDFKMTANDAVAKRRETLGCKRYESRNSIKCTDVPLRTDSYMGFSVAASDSLDNRRYKDSIYVAGAPRGNLTGAVVMYEMRTDARSTNLSPRMSDIILGDQVGSSFGFAVAVTDINGDGLDDLLVGAPQYYEHSEKGKHGGAVYIYINTANHRFGAITPSILLGEPDSFFGCSISALGDIDQDGFNDFAVGAPYEGNGKVHIYRGSTDGTAKVSQVLHGSDYVRFRPDLTGFGWSLSGDVDIDNNKYPDLMVGSLSDQIVLFRSRPVIAMLSTLEASTSILDLKAPNCQYKKKMYSCFYVDFCFTYTSRHKEYSEALAIKYTVTLDSNRQSVNKRSRIRFDSPKGDAIISEVVNIPRADASFCPEGTHRIFTEDNFKDRLHPIFIKLEFSLVSDENNVSPEAVGDPVFRMIRDPILDADYPNERNLKLAILNNCGNDGCQSNLRVGGSVQQEIVVGGSGKITLKLNASNDGEDAHQAAISVKLPNDVYYDNFTVTHSSGAAITCKPTIQGGSTFVVCSLGNPYETGSVDEINVDLDVSKLTKATKKIVFEVTGSTTSKNPKLPPLPLYSIVIIEMRLLLSGYGQPQQVRYSDAPIKGESGISSTDEIGPMINHHFIIRNDGSQVTGGIMLRVHFPYEIKNGKWLLYLVSSKVVAGGERVAGICSQENVNPLTYKLPSTGISQRRKKREAQEAEALYKPRRISSVSSNRGHRSTVNLNCQDKTAACFSIECSVEPIQPGSTVSVVLQSRLWNATFLEEFRHVDLVDVEVVGELVETDENIRISGEFVSKVSTTVDHIFFQDNSVSVFPWWYIVIGIIIAFIVYAIIIFLLIRCGFFKRKRYPVRDQDDSAALVEEKRRNDEEKL